MVMYPRKGRARRPAVTTPKLFPNGRATKGLSEGKYQGRANSVNPLALLKNKGQGRASSDLYDFFPE